MRKSRRARVVLGYGVVYTVLGLAGWVLCPGPTDARGPRYVLWKLGLFPFDAEVVYGSMVGDRRRDDLVVGKTLDELTRRFGRVRRGADCTPDQRFYAERDHPGEDLWWLGDSLWAVRVVDGRAVSLHGNDA